MSETVLMFLLAGQRLALPAGAVLECLPLPSLWHRPGLPRSVSGCFSLGGRMMPVVDLALLLGLRRAERDREGPDQEEFEQEGLYRHLIRVGEVALLVDRVTGLRPRGAVLRDGVDAWQHGCVQARFMADDGPVALLDPARILLEDERVRLAALAEAAQRRADGWRDAG